MPLPLKPLAAIRKVRDELASARPSPQSKDLAGDELAGAMFHPGDRVMDPVTGMEGTVEHVAYRHVTLPPA